MLLGSLPEEDFKVLNHKESKKDCYEIKTTREAPIVCVLTYRQTDCMGPLVWFVVVILFFPSLQDPRLSPNILESDAPL